MKQYIALIPLLLLFLCSYSVPNQSQQIKPGPGLINLTLHEGTNMAAALSPDKRTLALDLQGTIWIVPVGGGKAIAITDELGDCHEPAWSPDGTRLAFHSYRDGNYHIWTVKKDGSELRQITSGVYDEREPSWSPDGRTIVFSSDRKGNYDIWQVDLASRQVKALTSDVANEYNPAISPDGQSIAFVSQRAERGIYILKDGMETLITPSTSRLAAPSWNSKGDKILFVSYGAGISQLYQVNLGDRTKMEVSATGEDVFPFRASWINDDTFLYTANGKIQKRKIGEEKITIIPFEATVTLHRPLYERKRYNFDDQQEQTPMGIIGPVVSPDGNSVAFAALGDIYVQRIGGPIAQITKDSHVDFEPAWSPDGKTLAYVSDRGGKMEIWLRDMGTGETRLLTKKVEANTLMPVWSADGKKVAFYSKEPNALASGIAILKIVNLATGEIQTIPNTLFFPGKPSWSRDGNTIALMVTERYSSRYREGLNKFLLVSLQGDPLRYVSPDVSRSLSIRTENGPVWSPDGNTIAYVQDGVLWTVAVNGKGDITGTPRQVTTELADKISWSGDSKSIVYLATDHLKKVNIETGISTDIPIALKWKPQLPREQYIIHAGKLFNGQDSTYIFDADILIDGHRIKNIVPHQNHGTATVLDASGKVVMPGLFESHSHHKTNTGEKMGKIWLSYGITSVREPGSDPYDALERKESWSAGLRPGPRLFYSSQLDGSRVYYGLNNSVITKSHLDMELGRAGKLGYSLIKTYVRLSDSVQKEVTVAAHKMGIPVSSHELYPAASYNVDGAEHLAGTSRRGYSQRQSALFKIYDDVKQLTAASGMILTPTISADGGFIKMANENPELANNKQYKAFFSKTFIDSWIRPTYKDMKDYQKAVKDIVNSGGNVTAGTDGPLVPYGISLHAELWLFVNGGLRPYQALKSATINAAKAAGVDKDLGTVESGKLADMIIVDGDPLKNISDAWNVDTVIKNGIRYKIDNLLPQN